MTKGELMERMSSAELSEWMALWRLRGKEAEQARRKADAKRGRL